MLDIKYIREHVQEVEKNNKSRNASVDLQSLIALDDERISLQQKIDDLRSERNKRSKTKPSEDEIALIRKMGDEISGLEKLAKDKEAMLRDIVIKIPNLNSADTPIGKDDTENQVVRFVGTKPEFNFEPKEHFDVSHAAADIDMERGAKVSGSRFYYLKNKLAILERSIMQFSLDTMIAKGFELILPPILVKEDAMFGTGFFPADKNEVYSVNPADDNLYLIGTSEVPLIFMHSDEVLDVTDAPKKYISITPCFRREAGSYGKDTKGLIRVHQFYKVEMVVFCAPDQSAAIHEELLAHEEAVLQALGIHYQVVNVCSGDLGWPAAKKYDCEGWFPGQGRYRELTSTSNTTDYQARRSNIKYKTVDGKKEFAHTLNGTVTSDRPLLAIIENGQQADGSIVVPEILRKYTGFDVI